MFKEKPRQEIIVLLILITVFITLYSLNIVLIKYFNETKKNNWIIRALTNLLGYSSIIIPGFLAKKYLQKHKNNKNINNDNGNLCVIFIQKFIRNCFVDKTKTENDENAEKNSIHEVDKEIDEKSVLRKTMLLISFFAGLQISFGTSSYLQEKIMTQKYDQTDYFKDSQFLVFINRFVASILSGLTLLLFNIKSSSCPYYKYSVSSMTNILSSWTLYEALKYVNFPTQVLAKSCKPIPVMLMGKFVWKLKYHCYEYFTTLILSIGIILFMISVGETNNKNSSSSSTLISGIFLLLIFIIADSFTANWQGKLFKEFKMSPVQMMYGTNVFSCILTAISLSQQNSFIHSFYFIYEHPSFIFDCLLLSLFSGIGQFFIFLIIAKFGPLTFSIFSTIRQGVSILLSCIIFKHEINLMGVFGILIVFFSIALRTLIGFRRRRRRRKREKTTKTIEEEVKKEASINSA